MQLKRPNWWYRSYNEPWLEVVSDVEKIRIIIKGTTTSSDPVSEDTAESHSSDELKLVALQKILNFYGYHLDLQNSSTSMSLPWIPTINDVTILDYHFSSRKNAPAKLLYEIDKAVALPSRGMAPGNPIIEETVQRSVILDCSEIDKQLNSVGELFSTYQAKLKFFNGQLRPSFNFSHEYDRLKLAIEKLKEFIEFNGYKFKTVEEDKIIVNFSSDYKILFVEFSSKGQTKILNKGPEFFLKDSEGLKNRRTNRILSEIKEIYNLRNRPPTWSEFIYSHVNVEVDFFGPPSSDIFANLIRVEYGEGGTTPLFQTLFQAQGEDNAIAAAQAQMINESFKKIEKGAQQKLGKVAHNIKNVQNKMELVQRFLHKFGFSSLIAAALECAAIQAAKEGKQIPDMARIWETVKGMDPYDLQRPPMNWQMPKLPTVLPVIGINKAMTKGIKEALEEALIGMLVEMLKIIADMIVEMCRGYEEDEIGSGPSIAVIANQNPDLSTIPGETSCLFEVYDQFGMSKDLGDRFLEIVAENLAPLETCRLINGEVGGPDTYIILEEIINSAEFAAGEYEADLRDILDTQQVIVSFFERLGDCISVDYCDSIYRIPPYRIPPDIDPCALEERLAEDIPDEDVTVILDLLDAYENLDLPSTPDLGCGAGIVPRFENIPSLINSIITLLDSLFDGPATIFVGEVGDTKQAFIEIFPGDVPPEYWDQIQRLFEEPEGGASADDATAALGDLFSPLADQVLSNPLIGALANHVSGSMMIAQSAASYRVAEEYKFMYASVAGSSEETLATGGTGLTSPFEKNSFAGSTSQFRDFWIKLRVSPGDRVWMLLHGGSKEVWDLNPGSNLNSIGHRWPHSSNFFQSTLASFDDLAQDAFDDGMNNAGVSQSDLNAMENDLSSISRKNVYFSAFIAAMGAMSHAIGTNRLFDYDQFTRLLLTPRRCSGDETITVGDLFDIQNIINQAVNEFKENACAENVPCIVGPVEDAVIFAVASAYLQILVLEQILKNIFFIDTYGLGDYLATPVIMKKIQDEITQVINTNPYPEAELYSSDIANARASYVRSRITIEQACVLYTRKRLHVEEPFSSLEDPFGGANLVFSGPEASSLDTGNEIDWGSPSPELIEFSLNYMIRKRIYETIPAINEVFGLSGRSFDKTFLLHGLPHVNILDDPNHIYQKDSRGGTHGSIYAVKRTGSSPDLSESGEITGLQDLGFYDEILFPPPESNTIWAPNWIPPEGTSVIDQQNDFGAFGVEEYIKFDFDETYWDEFREEGDIGGTPEEILKYYTFERVESLLNETIFSDPGHRASRGASGVRTYITSIESYAQFIRGLMQLARRTAEYPELQRIMEEMVITYTWGYPHVWDRTPAVAVGSPQPEESWGVRYSSFKGPMTTKNFDAIRFWINEVQRTPIQGLVDPGEHTLTEIGHQLGNPLTTDVGVGGSAPTTDIENLGMAYAGSWDWAPITNGFANNIQEGRVEDDIDGGSGYNNTGYEESGPYKLENLGPRVQHPSFQKPIKASTSDWPSWAEDALDAFYNDPDDENQGAVSAANQIEQAWWFYTTRPDEPGPGLIDWTVPSLDNKLRNLWNESGQSIIYGSFISPEEILGTPIGGIPPFGGFLASDQEGQDHPTIFRFANHAGQAAGSTTGAERGAMNLNYPSLEHDSAKRIGLLYYLADDDASFAGIAKRAYIPQLCDLYGFIGMKGAMTPTGQAWAHGACSDMPGYLGPFGKNEQLLDLLNIEAVFARTAFLWSDWPDQNTTSGGFGPEITLDWSLDPALVQETYYNWKKAHVADLNTETLLQVLRSFFIPHGAGFDWPAGGDVQDLEINAGGVGIEDGNTAAPPWYPLDRSGHPAIKQGSGTSLPGPAQWPPGAYVANFWRGLDQNGDDVHLKMVNGIYLSDMEGYEQLRDISSTEMSAIIALNEIPQEEGAPDTPTPVSFLNGLMSNVKAASRVVYYTQALWGLPGTQDTKLRDRIFDPISSIHMNRQRNNFYRTRQNCILRMSALDSENGTYVANVGTPIEESVMLYSSMDELISAVEVFQGLAQGSEDVGAEGAVIYHAFASRRDGLCEAMANSTAYDDLFRNTFHIDLMGAFLFLAGVGKAETIINTYDNSDETRSQKLSLIFDDTKRSLITVLQAALAGDSYRYSQSRSQRDTARDAAMAMAGLGVPIAQMGVSFVLKMLIETPLNILKGLAEMIDPHIVFGKNIKNISGQVMNTIAGATGVSSEMIAEYINEGIEQVADKFDPGTGDDDPTTETLKEFFMPHATKHGIELIGRMPFLFAVPPTPLGILYILLNLAQRDQPFLEELPECPQLPAPDPDGPTTQLPESPTTTYGCPDEEE